MKKFLIIFLAFCYVIYPITSVFASDTSTTNKSDLEVTEGVNEEVSSNDNNANQLISHARSGMLIEATTGKVLFEKNPDERVAVASMTKMMDQILILEAIEKGTLTWEEKITVSNNAAGMGGSQIWLQPNEVMSVRDLMKGLSMASANDAAVALAERIGGSEAGFVEMMNQKAQELGLQNTHFVNATGLDEENHYSSARDMGKIAVELLKHDQILEFSSVYEDYLRVDTPNKFWLVNTNKLVRTYPGADGLKTGHTDAALYCMAVTAKKDNLRLVAIVLGEEDNNVRNSETASLLDYGFNSYKIQLLKAKGDSLGKITIEKGNLDNVEIVTTQDIGAVTKKSENLENLETELQMDEIQLPVAPGDVVGKVILKHNGEVLGEYPVTVKEEVKKTSFLRLFGRILETMFTGSNQ